MSERPRGLGPVGLGEVLGDFLRGQQLRGRDARDPVLELWAEVAGPRYAEQSQAVRFQQGELVVEVASAAHRAELAGFQAEPLRARLNARLGDDRVRRIVFKHRT